MEHLNSAEVSEVKNIISKLCQSKRFSQLSAEEVSILSGFAGIKSGGASGEIKRSLLSWIWENLLKYEKYSEIRSLIDLSDLEYIFSKESKRTFSRIPSGEIMSTLFTREELINACSLVFRQRKSSSPGTEDKVKGATLLSGLAGLKEFEKELVDTCLEKVDESAFSYRIFGHEIMANSFVSLILLNSQAVDKIADRFRTFSEESIKTTLLFYYDCYPEKITVKVISDFHDYLTVCDDTLVFSDFAFRVFQNESDEVTNLVLSKPYENKSDYIWGVICPAVFSSGNTALLKKLIEENDPRKLHRILLFGILNNAKWILPVLMEKIDSLEEKPSGDQGGSLPTLSMSTSRSDLVYYIITAAALSGKNCDWIRTYLTHKDNNIKLSAILGCTGKKEFLEEIGEMKGDCEKLISAAAAFACAATVKESTVYLDSLAVEMRVSSLDPLLFPYVYCILRKDSMEVPPDLDDLWLMTGQKDQARAEEFYRKYPYRLISWMFASRHRPNFSIDNFVYSDDDVRDHLIAVLMAVADKSFIGILKSFLYQADNETMGQLVLSILVELEQDDLTVETRTLKKIYITPPGEIIDLTEEEFPYALLFYEFGSFARRSDIVRSIRNLTEFKEILLRLNIESTSGNSMADAAVDASLRQPDTHEQLLRFIRKINDHAASDPGDLLHCSRILAAGSENLKTSLLEYTFGIGDKPPDEASVAARPLTEDEVHMLICLLPDSLSSSVPVLEILAKNIGEVPWLKDSINRWLKFKDEYSGYPDTLAEAGLRAASIIKSEEYLPVFIELLASKRPFSSTDTSKVLNIIGNILDNNPDSKFLFLRADDPELVKKAYNLNLKREYNFNSDNKLDSIKFISMALGKTADRDFACENAGKTLSINHEKELIDPALMQKSLTRAEFEKLALYLSVSYTDESSGLIIAEVMNPDSAEPSGEILNAILQSADYAVFTISWS